MPPLSTITLMQPVPVLPSPNTLPASARRLRSLSMGSSAEFCTTDPVKLPPTSIPQKEKDKQHNDQQTKQVSFNPRVRVIETHYVDDLECPKTKSIFDPSQTWYTEREIDDFQKHAFFIIQRFQRSWHLGPEDCLRGLECQTTKCTATKVRVHVYKDLLLAKQDTTKRMVQQSPQRVRQMMCTILRAAEQDALELAQKDAESAHNYQEGIEEDDDDAQNSEPGFKCFLWELPKWLVPKKQPAIVDVPI